MPGSRDDGPPPPDGEFFIVGGDGAAEPGQPAPGGQPSPHGRPPRSTGTGPRIGIALGVAAVFVFGVIVGRSGTVGGHASGPSTASTTTVDSATDRPTPSATRQQTRSSRNQPTTQPTAQPTATTSSTRSTVQNRYDGGTAATASTRTVSAMNPAFTAAIAHFIPGQPDIQSLAMVGDHLVVLAPGWLVRVSQGSHGGLYPDRGSDVGLPIGDPTYADWELLTDGHKLWALAAGPGRRLYSVDPSTLKLGPLTQPPHGIVDAVALDGHLYLNTTVGVLDATPSPHRGPQLPTVARGGRAMAADPPRHRLLVLNDDDGWAVTAYAPPGFHPVARASLPFQAQSIAVAGGAIWVTGYDAGSKPVLARLDPATLQVMGHAALLDRTVTSVPTIVAHGKDLWIRSEDGSNQLWCVNPHSGAVAQHWSDLPGIVAVSGGGAFVADGDVVGEVGPGICGG